MCAYLSVLNEAYVCCKYLTTVSLSRQFVSDVIEDNVDSAVPNVEEGVKQLGQAQEYQVSYIKISIIL